MKTGARLKSNRPSVPLVIKTTGYMRQSVPPTNSEVVRFNLCISLINKEVARLDTLNSEGGHQ